MSSDVKHDRATAGAQSPEPVILFAHGARSPTWAQVFEAIRDQCVSQGAVAVNAYLEFLQPDLGAAVDQLVAQGHQRAVIVPMFFAASGHVLRDLPGLIAAIGQRHPDFALRVGSAIGDDPQVQHAMAASVLRQRH